MKNKIFGILFCLRLKENRESRIRNSEKCGFEPGCFHTCALTHTLRSICAQCSDSKIIILMLLKVAFNLVLRYIYLQRIYCNNSREIADYLIV